MDAVSAANGDGAAVERLRSKLIHYFAGLLIKKLGLFKELGVNVSKFVELFTLSKLNMMSLWSWWVGLMVSP